MFCHIWIEYGCIVWSILSIIPQSFFSFVEEKEDFIQSCFANQEKWQCQKNCYLNLQTLSDPTIVRNGFFMNSKYAKLLSRNKNTLTIYYNYYKQES